MAQKTDKTTGKPKRYGAWVIMGLMAVSMVGFGAAGLSGTVRTIGSVGDKPISTQSYFQELNGQIALASQQAGRQLSFPEAEAGGLTARALAIGRLAPGFG